MEEFKSSFEFDQERINKNNQSKQKSEYLILLVWYE